MVREGAGWGILLMSWPTPSRNLGTRLITTRMAAAGRALVSHCRKLTMVAAKSYAIAGLTLPVRLVTAEVETKVGALASRLPIGEDIGEPEASTTAVNTAPTRTLIPLACR